MLGGVPVDGFRFYLGGTHHVFRFSRFSRGALDFLDFVYKIFGFKVQSSTMSSYVGRRVPRRMASSEEERLPRRIRCAQMVRLRSAAILGAQETLKAKIA